MVRSIRQALSTDAVSVAQIDVDSHLEAYGHIFGRSYGDLMPLAERIEHWRQAITKPNAGQFQRMLVAVEDGDIVGYICFGKSHYEQGEGAAEIDSLYVHPRCWRSGIGSDLMAAALAELKEAGFLRVELWALEANHIGRAFYERAGWCQDGDTRTPPHGEPEVRYRMALQGS